MHATNHVSWPFIKKESYDLSDWIPDEEEEFIAPVLQLEDWTGIKKEMLPPHEMLSDDQIARLLNALVKMLDAFNWMWVLQIEVPERIQYAAIRDNFDQPAKAKMWHMGFFQYCRPDTPHGQCTLGEYCHCAFFAEFFKDMVDD